jgi:hypothetical protein
LPCTAAEADYGFAFSGDPEVVVELGAGMRHLRRRISSRSELIVS